MTGEPDPKEARPRGDGEPRRLDTLLDVLTGPVRRGAVDRTGDARPRVTGLSSRADDVRPGHLFIALPGTSADGHSFIADAARRGAIAAVVERDVGGALDLPLIRVEDARRALGELAGEWHGRPAERLTLAGITGTAGKTSTLMLLERLLVAAERPIATIGSLGLRVGGETLEETVYTTPDPLVLQRELARAEQEGAGIVAMEATSHALVQRRLQGVRFDLGIFTNLLPLEHEDYHGSFEAYIEAKSLFFDLLEPGAPLVYNVDDPVTCRLMEARDLAGVPCGRGSRALIRVHTGRVRAEGTELRLEVREPVTGVGGHTIEPVTLDLRLRLLGRSNVSNATLAAAAALCLGADPDVIPDTLASFEPPRRRMEILHDGRFTILDDTVGHPESVNALFEVVQALEPRRVHVAWAVRGQRGERINRENAEALAVWAKKVEVETLVVTPARGSADELNQVEDAEYAAFTGPLREREVPFEEREALDPAVRTVLEAAGDGDLVLLLGAQGMNPGRASAMEWLEARGER